MSQQLYLPPLKQVDVVELVDVKCQFDSRLKLSHDARLPYFASSSSVPPVFELSLLPCFFVCIYLSLVQYNSNNLGILVHFLCAIFSVSAKTSEVFTCV